MLQSILTADFQRARRTGAVGLKGLQALVRAQVAVVAEIEAIFCAYNNVQFGSVGQHTLLEIGSQGSVLSLS